MEVQLHKDITFQAPDLIKNVRTGQVSRIPLSSMLRLLARNSALLRRLFRITPRGCAYVAGNTYLISLPSGIYKLSDADTVELIYATRPGFSAALNFAETETGVYWGDYGNNADREEVNIYRYSERNGLKVVFTFPAGKIRHVHNVIVDVEKRGFWVLTGDTEPDAGIYFANEDFSEVVPVTIGKQQYRAVVGFPTESGLLYATDAVEEDNYIYRLACRKDSCEVQQLMAINGSCIYGTELKDYYVFSTTVEPQEGRGLLNMLTYKLGKGIKSRDVHVIAVNKQTLQSRRVIALRKDIWPMKLFQYGAAQFPGGLSDGNELICNVVACKKFDGKILKYKL